MRRFLTAAFAALLAATAGRAAQLSGLPGEDVSGGEVEQSAGKVIKGTSAAPRNSNWLSPPVEEQLSRDGTLIPLGKGALFVPTYTEPRREPEVSILDPHGKLVKSAQTGERILLDSGDYSIRFGSGTSGQQIPMIVSIEEGHTTVVPPTWGGLIVETLAADGDYVDAQYEVIRMEKWINFGKGHGLKQERLQDIRTWILPPGMYRISQPGEGYNSLRNYITVQINPGELSQIELIYDKAGGDIISGGAKSFNARLKVGSYWTYGLRAGGNVDLARTTDETDTRKETMQLTGDLRMRAVFDNLSYLGTTELLLQDNFFKERGHPFSVNTDIAQFRTNWVRRLNAWLGPYIRATMDTHIFNKLAEQDTVQIVEEAGTDSTGKPLTRTRIDTSGTFLARPTFDPLNLTEGMGVNIEFISKYYLEATAQFGIAAHQNLAEGSYLVNNQSQYFRAKSTYELGGEGTLNATLRLGSQMALDLRLEMFAPNADPARLHLDDLTADFRFFLSRNIEIGYLYHVAQTQSNASNRFPSSHSLSLRLSFNY
jgi:hypothetical protein